MAIYSTDIQAARKEEKVPTLLRSGWLGSVGCIGPLRKQWAMLLLGTTTLLIISCTAKLPSAWYLPHDYVLGMVEESDADVVWKRWDTVAFSGVKKFDLGNKDPRQLVKEVIGAPPLNLVIEKETNEIVFIPVGQLLLPMFWADNDVTRVAITKCYLETGYEYYRGSSHGILWWQKHYQERSKYQITIFGLTLEINTETEERPNDNYNWTNKNNSDHAKKRVQLLIKYLKKGILNDSE